MFYSTVLLAASALAGLVSAQTSIDPNSVSTSDRSDWCRAETNTCPILCGGIGSISVNNCSTTTLEYGCVCSNGLAPNVSDYEQTIPYYVCIAWRDQCNDNNAGNATAQESCQAVLCPTSTAENVVTSSASSTAASATGGSGTTTSGSGASGTGSSTASTASSTKTGAASAISVGKEYGFGVLIASMFGVFAFAL